MLKWLKPNGWLFLFGTFDIATLYKKYLTYRFDYIWVKPNVIMQTPNTVHPFRNHEIIWAFVQDGVKPSTLYFDPKSLSQRGRQYKYKMTQKRFDKSEFLSTAGKQKIGDYKGVNHGTRVGVTVLSYPNKPYMRPSERTAHPTQKPQALIELLINGHCPPGGIVVDPTAGSGTTMVAAHNSGRRCVSAEIDDGYREIIRNRFERMI